MAELSTKQRKNLNKSDFAIPEKAPGSGSFPIHDLAHARNALARASGKPEEARVKRAVYKKYPQLKPGGSLKESPLSMRLRPGQLGDLSLLEAPATEDIAVKCPSCGKTVTPNADGDCPNCGQDLSKVEAAAKRMAARSK